MVKFGSWNVRTMYRPGATCEVERELKKYNETTSLQEIRWPGIEECELEHRKLFYMAEVMVDVRRA